MSTWCAPKNTMIIWRRAARWSAPSATAIICCRSGIRPYTAWRTTRGGCAARRSRRRTFRQKLGRWARGGRRSRNLPYTMLYQLYMHAIAGFISRYPINTLLTYRAPNVGARPLWSSAPARTTTTGAHKGRPYNTHDIHAPSPAYKAGDELIPMKCIKVAAAVHRA